MPGQKKISGPQFANRSNSETILERFQLPGLGGLFAAGGKCVAQVLPDSG
jgi:hypothetical protein